MEDKKQDEKMKEEKTEKKIDSDMEEKKTEKAAEKKEEKVEQKTEDKPAKEAKKIVKKEEAIANGLNLPASKKHCMYISRFILHKTIDAAISDLEAVIKLKKAVPFKGEIPHRKGMMSGRYPVNASKEVINVLKGLRGNALVNGMDLDKTKIVEASANWAQRPQKRFGGRFKRAHIMIKVKEMK